MATRLTASDIYTYYRPSACELRVFLRQRGESEAEPGPFEVLIRRLGERHERQHLATLGPVADLSAPDRAERESLTRKAIADSAPIIYHGALRASTQFGGQAWEVVGDPDFLIRTGNGYLVRDSKLARRINTKDHPEIILSVQLYGWLFEQTFGQAPVGLEVFSGAGKLVSIDNDGGKDALTALDKIAALKLAGEEPYSPVGWTKCGGCAFHDRCWPQAEARSDVALVYGVDQGLARVLRENGVETIAQLVERFDPERLAAFRRPKGERLVRVGRAAEGILRAARSMVTGREISIAPPQLPPAQNVVIFDVEGLPPYADELDKIYLWGLQVFGERPGSYRAGLADFGVDGDRKGWFEFLDQAREMFASYGDLSFIHWHHYERVQVQRYIERYGDPDGTAARVLRNLLDLLPVVRDAVALPIASYSLKVIEKYVGFSRSQEEYGGDWAMAKYIEATETADPVARDATMQQILLYNAEDLAATWAVLQWLRDKSGRTT